MKEHEDDVLPSVQSAVTVDSTIVTERLGGGEGKVEGSERDEVEDIMVDVVGADAIGDDHGRTGVNFDCKAGSNGLVEEDSDTETRTLDQDMEEVVGSGKNVCDAPVQIRVLDFEKAEVIVSEEASKDVLQNNVITTVTCGSEDDAQKSGNGIIVGDSKMDFEPSSREPEVGGETAVNGSEEVTERGLTEVVVQPLESVQEVADGDGVTDEKTGKEGEVLDSLKIEESLTTIANLGPQEVDMVVVKGGLAGKDEAANSVFVDPSLACPNSQPSSTEVVNAGTGESVFHVSTENLHQMSKEESLLPKIEVIKDNAQTSGNETEVGDTKVALDSVSGELRFVGGVSAVVDIKEASERGLTEEFVERRPVVCDQEVADEDCVANEESRKEEEVLDSSKISEPSTAANPGSEDVDVVVVEEGLASKDEAQDSVSVDPSLVCPDNQSLSTEDAVNVNAENLNQQIEVDKLSKEESLHPTIEVITNDAQESKNRTGVEDSIRADESSSGETAVIDRGEKERDLKEDKETVERSAEPVQKMDNGDGVMDEKDEKEEKVLESSMVPESLSTANLGSEEVDVVVVEEGLTRENEAQDIDSVEARLVCPTEVVHVNAENPYQQADVDPTSKGESWHPTIEVISTHASHEQVVDVKPTDNSLESPTTFGGDLVSSLDTTKPFAGGGTEQIKHKVSAQPTLEAFSEHHQGVVGGGEVLTTDHKICDSGKSVDDVEVEGSKLSVDESSNTEVATCTETDEVAARIEVHEVTTTVSKLPNSEVQVPSALTESSKRVPESSIDQTESATANKVVEIDSGGENCKSAEDQGLKVDIGVPNRPVEVPSTDVAKHCVLPESEFSYEEAHMEKGEDAGMDIDEVLGWKDEMPGIDVNSEAELGQVFSNSSREPVVIGQQEEDIKFRQPIVYERRAHVEVPLYDALDGHGSPPMEDEKLQVETDSEEDDRSVQEEEQKVVEPPTNKEPPLAPLDTVSDGNHVNDAKDSKLERSSEAEQSTVIDDVTKNGASLSLNQWHYFQPPENEGQFSVSDLVWGKIRSHPWWPGQICDPSDASDKAMKYHKKNCFLIAYFGDGTFAWNDSSVLKPFRANFSQIEKHGTSESFKNAVTCALEEVSRRVELGLACTCVPRDIYKKIEYQAVENGGIRRKSNKRYGIDESAGVNSFEPDKLVDYVRLLARFPRDERDKMELIMAKAQLSSYGHYKGYRQLPEFQLCGDLLEDISIQSDDVADKSDSRSEYPNKKRNLPKVKDADMAEAGNITSNLVSSSGSKKRKALDSVSNGSEKRPNLRADMAEGSNITSSSGSKRRKVLDSVSNGSDKRPNEHTDVARGGNITSNLVSSSGFKKRKVLDSVSDGSEKRPNLHPQKGHTTTPTSKPSFKVGECIQRVASQLTGPPSVQKCSSDRKVEHDDVAEGSVAEMLSQLCLTAQDPMKEYSFLNTIIPFFYSHRSAVFIKSIRQNSSTGTPISARKQRPSDENDEKFEFDDVNDSYWTDRIIQNYPEDQLLQDNQNGDEEYQLTAYVPDKPDKTAKPSRRSNKKRVLSSNHEIESKEELELMERRRQNLATEIVLKFTEGIYFPSEIQLNKMFRRFGPLMESETEVDRQGGCARVVFKKCSDAEVAQSSAGKFNIFGSINVNYEVNYTPLISYKPLPLPILEDPMDAS